MTTTAPLYRTRDTCRVSGEPLESILSLGDLALSGFVQPGQATTPTAPLELAYGPKSGLVQLRHTVEPERLFGDAYWYRSGVNESMVRHLEELARDAQRRRPLEPGDVVVDIGANDGTFLGFFPEQVYKIAYEPSDLFPFGADEIHHGFFTAEDYAAGPAKLVTSIAMLYDVEDLAGFCRDVAAVLADDGLWVTEQHYLPEMLRTNDYSVICHEHLTYLTVTALANAARPAGLQIVDVTLNAANGGSFRAYLRKRPAHQPYTVTVGSLDYLSHVPLLLGQERDLDFARFSGAVEANREATLALLAGLQRRGKLVLGYGASTKFNTVLNYCGIGPGLLPAIAERSPEKVGLVTAGTHIPIVSEADARAMQPDYLLIGPWHFLDAFKQRERAFLERGGRFIVLFPVPHIVPYGIERIAA